MSKTANTPFQRSFAPYAPPQDPVLPTTVPELQALLTNVLTENQRLRETLARVDESDTGIVNWLQANSDIVEVKLHTVNNGVSTVCWHFIVHKGKSLRDMVQERMQHHMHR